jgi:Family of unknown function (DUF5675)
MNIEVKRRPSTAQSTLSEWFVNGVFECYGIEDVVRPTGEAKVFGKTAIPAGTYQVIISWSPRFKRPLPLLLNVPGFAGVRIHAGNTAADTEGCLLPGTGAGKDMVTNSRVAFEKLFRKIEAAAKKGRVLLTIR